MQDQKLLTVGDAGHAGAPVSRASLSPAAGSFTPGPWHEDAGFIYGERGSVVVCDPHLSGGPEDHAERDANARLIAAAPELLAALVATLDRYVGFVNSGDGGHWEPEEEDHVIAARAAIAKATGNESAAAEREAHTAIVTECRNTRTPKQHGSAS